MCLHKLIQLFLFIQFVRSGQTLLFLSHVEHHFLNSWSGLSVEIWQFRWLRVDFLRINFRVSLNWSTPPRSLVFPLLNVDVQVFSLVSIQLTVLNGPVSLFWVYIALPLSINKLLTLDSDFKFFHSEVNFHVLFGYISIDEDEHLKILILGKGLLIKFASKCTYHFFRHCLLGLVHCLITSFMRISMFRFRVLRLVIMLF